MKRITVALAAGALLTACADTHTPLAPEDALLKAAAGAERVDFEGNGFSFDGTTWTLNDERCGLEGQGTANDGGTGQFDDGFEPGDPYLVWVLTSNRGAATLYLPDGPVEMIRVGGTLKYASQYYSYEDLEDVHAMVTGGARNMNLVVSHGCAPYDGEGAWCSPGYWSNARDGAWALIAPITKESLFNEVVVPSFYATANADAALTVWDVLTYQGSANHYGAADEPFGLNAFNATGAALTDAIPGFDFNPDRIGDQDACPIDNHGNFK